MLHKKKKTKEEVIEYIMQHRHEYVKPRQYDTVMEMVKAMKETQRMKEEDNNTAPSPSSSIPQEGCSDEAQPDPASLLS